MTSPLRHWSRLAVLLVTGCETAFFGPSGETPAGDPPSDEPDRDDDDGRDDDDRGPRDEPGPGACVDEDGDGFGAGCAAGQDCDDGDATRSDVCTFVGFGAPWALGEREGVVVDEDGALTLGEDATQDDWVWVANSFEGTVSRLDAPTGHELGRYPSALPGAGARPADEECDMHDAGNCPSRTAIDFRRDAWVANRAFGHQGTVTKIAAHPEDCVDADGDGVIGTSTDDDGDGRISAGELRGEDDECVLFTVPVGGEDGVPRALAIAPDPRRLAPGGNAWVGLNRERRAVELDGATGEVLRDVELPLAPYGALAGKVQGLVWFVNAGWQAADDNPPAIVAVSIETGEVQERIEVESDSGCVGAYGITLDEAGRVWVAGNPCETAFRYDPRDGSWLTAAIDGQGWPRGLVGAGDGTIWVAHSTLDGETVGRLSRIDADTGSVLLRTTLPTGIDAIGVDLDRQGNVWTVNRRTGNVAKLDPVTDRVEEFPVGLGPYTYSDFTGHSLRLLFPEGTWRAVAEACGGSPATWLEVRWAGDIPEGTSVELRARTAGAREALEAASWAGPWATSPADLSELDAGAVLEMELALRSVDGTRAPRVTEVEATYACPIE